MYKGTNYTFKKPKKHKRKTESADINKLGYKQWAAEIQTCQQVGSVTDASNIDILFSITC